MAIVNKYLASAVLASLVGGAFYKQFWVSGIFIEKGVEQELAPSALIGLKRTESIAMTESDMFGLYDKQENASEENSIEQLFDIANKEYVGQIANYQFILYATAEFGGSLSAKILSKNLDDDSVELKTVRLTDQVANAVLSKIQLTTVELTGTDENKQSQKIDLKLFSRIDVPAPTES